MTTLTDPSQIIPGQPAAPPPLAPDETGQNYAPAAELARAKKPDVYKPVNLLDFLKEVRTEMRKEKESEEWRARILASMKNDLYYRGYQKLRKADLSNSWRVQDSKPVLYTLNEFQFWCNVNVSKWNDSRVDYRISGLNDTEDAQAAASKIEWVADYYDDRDWTRTDVVNAAKQSQFTGYLIAYVYYDQDFKPRQAYIPVTERVTEKLGQDAYRCADCNHVGTVTQPDANQPPDGGMSATAPVCEACGSDRVAVTQTPEIDVEKVTGQESVQVGDVTHQLIPLYNICWKARLGLERSPAVLWEEEHDRDQLESRWVDLQIPSATSQDIGISAKSSLENAGRGSNEKSNKVVLTRLWIEPSRFNRVKLKEELQTVAGEVIPEGTPLSERFPKGMHAIMIGDLVVDLYETDKNLDLCVMEYESVPNGLAQGVDAMCEPQRQLNTVNSLINLGIRHNMVPPLQYIEGAVDPSDLSGDPTKPYPVDPAFFELYPNVNPENAVMYKQGQTIPQGLFNYKADLRTAIQFAAHATEFANGLPSADNKTLGGAQIGQSLAQGIYSSRLAAFADFRVEIIKRKLKKFKRHVWDQRFFALAGDYGIQEGEYLSGHDIPDDFEITPVPNSWAPRTPRQQQQNMQALIASIGGMQFLPLVPPVLLAQLCEAFDVRLTDNEYPAAIRTARMRIKQAEKLLPHLQIANQAIQAATGAPPMAEPQATPPPVAQTPVGPVPVGQPGMVQQPVSPGQQLFEALVPKFNVRESGHSEAAEYLSKFLTTDAGLVAPEEIIDFVGVLQLAHIQAQAVHNEVRAGLSGQMPMSAPPQPNMSAAAAVPVGG